MSRVRILLATLVASAAVAQGPSVLLSDFESRPAVRIGGEGVQPGSRVDLVEQPARSGDVAARLIYEFVAETPGLQYVGLGAPLTLPDRIDRFTAWVHGDGAGQTINLRLRDRSGETHQFTLGRADHVGWRNMAALVRDGGLFWGGDANGRLDPPLALDLLIVDSTVQPAVGEIVFDDLGYTPEATVDPPHAWPLTLPERPELQGPNRRAGSAVALEPDAALRLDYAFSGEDAEHLIVPFNQPLPAAAALAAWVEGDAGGQTLRFRVRDAGGETHQLTYGPVAWTGWRRVELPLPTATADGGQVWGGDGNRRLDPPLTFESVVLDRAAAGTGTLRLRRLSVIPARAEAQPVEVLAQSFDRDAPQLGGARVHDDSRLVRDPAEKRQGEASWRLDYHFEPGDGLQYAEFPIEFPMGDRPAPVTLWVRGDGSGNPLNLRLIDGTGEWLQYRAGVLDFTDWRAIELDWATPEGHWDGDNDGVVDPPVRLRSIVVDSAVEPSQGSVWFDALSAQATLRPADVLAWTVEPGDPTWVWEPGEAARFRLSWTDRRQGGEADATLRVLLREAGGAVRDVLPEPRTLVDGRPIEIEVRPERAGLHELALIWQVGDDVAHQVVSFAALPPMPETNVDTNPFGACLHYAQHKGIVPLNYEILARAGGLWARDEYGWGTVEPEPGVYRFPDYNERYMREAAAAGVRLLQILDYRNANYDEGMSPTSETAQRAFAEYSYQMVARYKDVCKHWEVYNEPNIGFWKPTPDPVAYARLLKLTYAAVKRADAQATVLGISTAGIDFDYIEAVLKEGAGPFMDALSVHPYRYPRSPEESDFVGDLQRLHALMEQYGIGDKPVWITEIGWPNHVGPRGSTEEQTANYLVRMVSLSRSQPYMGPVIWYDLQNDGTDPAYNENNFGLIRLDYTPKLPYVAAAMMNRVLATKRFAADRSQGALYVHEYEGDGERTLVVWSTPTPTDVELALDADAVEVSDVAGRIETVPVVDGRLTLTAGEAPVFVTGRFGPAGVQRAGLALLAPGGPAFPGDTVRLPLVGSAAGAAVTADAPRGWSAEVAGAGGERALVVQVPAEVSPGSHAVGAQAGEARASLDLEVASPLALRLVPVLRAPGWGVAARVRNLTGRDLDGLGLERGGASVALPRLAPGAAALVDLPGELPAAPGERRQGVSVALAWPGGGRLPLVQVVNTWAAPRLGAVAVDGDLDEWAGVPTVGVGDWQAPTQGQRPAEADLGAAAQVACTAEGLALAVRVRDDQHVQTAEPADAWQMDGIQWAVDPQADERDETTPRHREFGLSLGAGGAALYRFLPTAEALPGDWAAAVREDGETRYEALLPWSALGLGAAPEPGRRLGFGLVVNENDGAGREGWLQLFGGIGWRKDAAELGTLVLGAAGGR